MTYELREEPPSPETYLALREAVDMTPRPREGVETGLPNSLYAVTVVHVAADGSETPVGMGRVVGDGGTVYHICDMVVHPDHQGRGLGRRVMDAIMAFVEDGAHPGAYVNLMADVDGFYEQWGFERTAPASKGMCYWVE